MKSKEFDYKVKGKKRIRCTKCGELGHFVKYDSGSSIMKHKAKINEYLGCVEIVKSCFFNGSIN